MPRYSVVIPIAGHLIIDVEANCKDSAISKAFEEATIDDLENWEMLEQFNKGNVCYCPSPWEVEVDKVDE